MKKKGKMKRTAIIAVIVYVMINGLVWGFMKAYVNSHNAMNHEKLVMAQITDSSKGKQISVLGNSICIPSKIKHDSNLTSVVKSLIPSEIRAVSELFMRSGQEIVQEVLE